MFVGSVAAHPPLTRRQADRLARVELLADEPVGLRVAWTRIELMWEATVSRALLLGHTKLGQRVNGEWSFLETLRHLVFVTDAWIGDVVLEQPLPYDRLGVPPDFVTNGHELGIDPEAKPTTDDVLDSRQRVMAQVRDLLSQCTTDDLARRCAPRDGRFRVVGALQVLTFEEWAHHQYAERDLADLEREADTRGSPE